MEKEKNINKVEIFILGAGPAGLSAVHALQKENISSYILIDLGKRIHDREKYDNENAFMGSGGAGLYSDGKFSFYPCGTKVWELPNEEQISKSYEILARLFKDAVDFNVPSFSKNQAKADGMKGCFNLKEYPSFYLSYEKRKNLIQFLCESGEKEGKVLMRHKLLGLEKISDEEFLVTIEDLKTKIQTQILTKWIILAGGKYFPLYIEKFYEIPQIFRRVEYGARVSAPNHVLSSFFVQDYEKKNLIDPKWVCPAQLSGVEYKTFCMLPRR